MVLERGKRKNIITESLTFLEADCSVDMYTHKLLLLTYSTYILTIASWRNTVKVRRKHTRIKKGVPKVVRIQIHGFRYSLSQDHLEVC